MKLLKIQNGYTTFSLSRLQYASLSRACWFASQEGLDPEIDHWRTLAALFHCCACCAAANPPSGALSPPTLLHPELAYVTWHNDIVTLELSARQCASLAKACWFAGQNSPDKDADRWLTLAALFQACAIAGFGQWQMGPAELAELAEIEALAGQLRGDGWASHKPDRSFPQNRIAPI